MEIRKTGGQEMIVVEVHYNAGIFSVAGTDTVFAAGYHRMVIGEIVDEAVQLNSLTDTIRVQVFFISLNEIRNKISDHDLIVGAGEVDVGEEIQRYEIRICTNIRIYELRICTNIRIYGVRITNRYEHTNIRNTNWETYNGDA